MILFERADIKIQYSATNQELFDKVLSARQPRNTT